jgi:hypothetical protein
MNSGESNNFHHGGQKKGRKNPAMRDEKQSIKTKL